MTYDQLNEYIAHYLTKDMTQRAIMLTSGWGTGKSYYVKNFLVPYIEDVTIDGTDKKYDCIVISLYGVKDIYEVSRAIFLECKAKFLNKKSEGVSAGKLAVKTVIKGLSSFFNVDLSKNKDDLQELFESIDLSDKLVIIEDVERSSLDIVEVMGYVNSLVEQDGVKVLLVANEDELLKYEDITIQTEVNGTVKGIVEKRPTLETAQYLRVKEKTVSDTISFKGDYESAIKDIFSKFFLDKRIIDRHEFLRWSVKRSIISFDYINRIVSIMSECNCFNLRSFTIACQKAADIYADIYAVIESYIGSYIELYNMAVFTDSEENLRAEIEEDLRADIVENDRVGILEDFWAAIEDRCIEDVWLSDYLHLDRDGDITRLIFYGILYYVLRQKSGEKLTWDSESYLSFTLGSESTPLFKFCYDYINEQVLDKTSIVAAFGEYKEFQLLVSDYTNDRDIAVISSFQLHGEVDVLDALKNIEQRLGTFKRDIPFLSYGLIAACALEIESISQYKADLLLDAMLENLKEIKLTYNNLTPLSSLPHLNDAGVLFRYREFCREMKNEINHVESDLLLHFDYFFGDTESLKNEIINNIQLYTNKYSFLERLDMGKLSEMYFCSSPEGKNNIHDIFKEYQHYAIGLGVEYLTIINRDLKYLKILKDDLVDLFERDTYADAIDRYQYNSFISTLNNLIYSAEPNV